MADFMPRETEMVLESALQRCGGFSIAREVPEEVRKRLSNKAQRLLNDMEDVNEIASAEELVQRHGTALMYAYLDGGLVYAEVRAGDTPRPTGLWHSNGKAVAKRLLKELSEYEFMFEI